MKNNVKSTRQKERPSNSLQSKYCALKSSHHCLEMMIFNCRQQRRELVAHLRAVTGEEAEVTAHSCDHFGINASRWWKAVKLARKYLKGDFRS